MKGSMKVEYNTVRYHVSTLKVRKLWNGARAGGNGNTKREKAKRKQLENFWVLLQLSIVVV